MEIKINKTFLNNLQPRPTGSSGRAATYFKLLPQVPKVRRAPAENTYGASLWENFEL